MPMGFAAGSSLNAGAGGYESVIHRLTAAMPYGPGLSVRRLSNSVEALLSASRPVTTLRMSDAVAVVHVSRIAASEQNVLRNIDASGLHSTQATCRAVKGPQHRSTRQRGQEMVSLGQTNPTIELQFMARSPRVIDGTPVRARTRKKPARIRSGPCQIT